MIHEPASLVTLLVVHALSMAMDLHGSAAETGVRSSARQAHTALFVAAVSGLWPWMRWPQRVIGLTVAALIACNRIYIGAHWPVDEVGGAAIGMYAGAIAWLVATRWPIRTRTARLGGEILHELCHHFRER